MADGCINPVNITPSNNEVILQNVEQTITVVDNNYCATVDVTQPVTSVIQILTGPVGPRGLQGPSNSNELFRILTGSVSASVDVGPTIFLINSGSLDFFTINNQGSTTISSSANDIFLIRNANNTPVLTVSQSGIVVLSTQSLELIGPAPIGGIYFTSSSFYVGLD